MGDWQLERTRYINIYVAQRNHVFKIYQNSEANALEILENPEEMLSHYL